jgi:putative SbcD/Mre11-related phosphoesterase
MNYTRFELWPGVILDARRAVYLDAEGVLAVADLHLGYAWAHRNRGQLMPLSVPDDTTERITLLLEEYRPRTLAVLGDIVHDTVPIAEFRVALRAFLQAMEAQVELRLIAGNHDRWLAREITQPLLRDWQAGPHRFLHGDGHSSVSARLLLRETQEAGGRMILGHEHPAIGISDGVAHYARVPCFLASDHWLVLPAFSSWAAGGDVRRGTYLSPFPEVASPTKAVAVLAGKLLPIPLRS